MEMGIETSFGFLSGGGLVLSQKRDGAKSQAVASGGLKPRAEHRQVCMQSAQVLPSGSLNAFIGLFPCACIHGLADPVHGFAGRAFPQ